MWAHTVCIYSCSFETSSKWHYDFWFKLQTFVITVSKYMQQPRGIHFLVNFVPMREQKPSKLTINSVFDILNLIPLFTVLALKLNSFHGALSKNNHFHCSPLKPLLLLLQPLHVVALIQYTHG